MEVVGAQRGSVLNLELKCQGLIILFYTRHVAIGVGGSLTAPLLPYSPSTTLQPLYDLTAPL